jgi:hypothetical protein
MEIYLVEVGGEKVAFSNVEHAMEVAGNAKVTPLRVYESLDGFATHYVLTAEIRNKVSGVEVKREERSVLRPTADWILRANRTSHHIYQGEIDHAITVEVRSLDRNAAAARLQQLVDRLVPVAQIT